MEMVVSLPLFFLPIHKFNVLMKYVNRNYLFKYLLIGIIALFVTSCYSQDGVEDEVGIGAEIESSSRRYKNENFHEVKKLIESNSTGKVKNIILMIGDGMGSAQVFAGITANKGHLNIENCTHTGFSKTSASNGYITDSAAGATAMACGVKTYNGAIGVDASGKPVETILELAEKNGLKTGLVATCRITHATPASFISHQPQRSMYEDIAEDFLHTDIDVFIGGGRGNFSSRKDGKNFLDSLRNYQYTIVTDPDSLKYVKSGKLAGLIHEEDQYRYSEGRGNMLKEATTTALEILDNSENGFFLMIEGSQIDWGGHDNNTGYIIEEMLDFDRAIGQVLAFAERNGETLVIITADHETGGFSIINGDNDTGEVEGAFTTTSHTPVMVPVYAFGPSADTFAGIYENTEIFYKMKEAFGF